MSSDLADRIGTIVHAFSDRGRKDAIRGIADEVERMEHERLDLRAQLAAEAAQTLKYQAALARAERQLAAVTAERDAARVELMFELSNGPTAEEWGKSAAALSEAAARNGVLLTEIAEARQCLLPGRIEPVRAAAALSRALSAPAVVDPRVEELVDALRWYGHHSSGCYQESRECCCGLDGAITAWGKR